MNIYIINVHATAENTDEKDKDDFYDELSRIYDDAPGNVVKIVVGDCNAKIRKETLFMPTIGTQSAHHSLCRLKEGI